MTSIFRRRSGFRPLDPGHLSLPGGFSRRIAAFLFKQEG